jgi:hypothetical protein
MANTPPVQASVANSSTATDLAALQAAANQAFINDAAVAIQQAIANGHYICYLVTTKYCDTPSLLNYFVSLGYQVQFPDAPNFYNGQPAELFGEAYVAYWTYNLAPQGIPNPTRIGLSWATPGQFPAYSNYIDQFPGAVNPQPAN